MNAKEKRLSIGFAVFLLLCAAINFVHGRTGAAVCCLGAGAFCLAVSFADRKKSQ